MLFPPAGRAPCTAPGVASCSRHPAAGAGPEGCAPSFRAVRACREVCANGAGPGQSSAGRQQQRAGERAVTPAAAEACTCCTHACTRSHARTHAQPPFPPPHTRARKRTRHGQTAGRPHAPAACHTATATALGLKPASKKPKPSSGHCCSHTTAGWPAPRRSCRAWPRRAGACCAPGRPPSRTSRTSSWSAAKKGGGRQGGLRRAGTPIAQRTGGGGDGGFRGMCFVDLAGLQLKTKGRPRTRGAGAGEVAVCARPTNQANEAGGGGQGGLRQAGEQAACPRGGGGHAVGVSAACLQAGAPWGVRAGV